MTPRKFRTPHNSIDGLEENQQGPGSIRAKLQSASKEKLIELIERLAADSEKLSARIDYLTDSGTAAKTLQRRISSLRQVHGRKNEFWARLVDG